MDAIENALYQLVEHWQWRVSNYPKGSPKKNPPSLDTVKSYLQIAEDTRDYYSHFRTLTQKQCQWVKRGCTYSWVECPDELEDLILKPEGGQPAVTGASIPFPDNAPLYKPKKPADLGKKAYMPLPEPSNTTYSIMLNGQAGTLQGNATLQEVADHLTALLAFVNKKLGKGDQA